MKFVIGATIPVMSYGNLQPSIEVEAETFEEAQAIAMPQIEKLWDKYGEKPLTKGERKLIKAYVGGEIYYDDATHTYTNEKGEVYMSGSQYAKSLEKPFDMEKISEAMATKFKVKAEDIKAMWALKSDISTGFGTAIHGALELYGRYKDLAGTIEKTTHHHDHPVIKKAVEGFYKGREGEKAVHEVFIVDHKAKRAGQIDRLLIVSPPMSSSEVAMTKDNPAQFKKGVCRVQDFKTNASIEKSLPSYWIQLQFYADIMTANGWIVEGLDIFHWAGEWKTYEKQT